MLKTSFNKRFGRIIKGIRIEKLAVIFSIFVLIVGIIFGALAASIMNDSQFYIYNEFFENFVFNTSIKLDEFDIFYDSFIKYAKTAAAIWFLGFINIGIIGIVVLIFIKGAGIGFTVSLIFQSGGIFAIFNSYFLIPQCIFIIPMYIIASFFSIKLIFFEKGNYAFVEHKKQFFFLLPLYMTICLIASFADIYFIK